MSSHVLSALTVGLRTDRISTLDQAAALSCVTAIMTREGQAQPNPLLSNDDCARLLNASSVGIVALNGDARVVNANATFCALLEQPLSELSGRLLWELGGTPSGTDECSTVARLHRQGYLRSTDLHVTTKTHPEMRMRFRRLGHGPGGVDIIAVELTRYSAEVGSGSGSGSGHVLHDHEQFEQLVMEGLEHTRLHRQPLSLLSITVDAISPIRSPPNASSIGLSRRLSELCKTHFRASDTVGQIDNESLLILLPGARSTDAVAAAERFRTAIVTAQIPYQPKRSRCVTVSIGVITTRTGRTSYRALRSRVDAKRDDASSQGGNRVIP